MPQDTNGDMAFQGGGNNGNGSFSDFLLSAQNASESGNSVLAMYLYLAAFEDGLTDDTAPNESALEALKRAWVLACQHKERSLAEYIFERLEPYLSESEITVCAEQLQDLALEKLEEFGFSRDDMQEMAEMISEDIFRGQEGNVKINHIMTTKLPSSAAGTIFGGIGKLGQSDKQEKLSLSEKSREAEDSDIAKELDQVFKRIEEHIDYSSLCGYSSAIKDMNSLGIGLGDSAEFQELVKLLNSMHGLSKKPALDTMMITCQAREDANRFMLATLGELNLPTVHMCMEENLQGMPLLCVSARDVTAPKSSSLRDLLNGPGVLVLEDIDTWASPMGANSEDSPGFFVMQLTRGAREAVGLIREAVENPEIFVICTASNTDDIEDFFLELFNGITVIEIDEPTPEERVEIWNDVAIDHPSIRAINRTELVRLSANMSRFDIYMAVREAIEDAYKQGLRDKRYREVTRDNLFEKIANYQPLESKEYHELEDAIINDFKSGLDNLNDLYIE